MPSVSSRKSYRVGRSYAGLGLFATKPFRKGDFIIRYRGPRITAAQADARDNKYLFELNSRWTLDGVSRANTARYANHSCRPNAESDVIRGRKVIIRAIRRIEPGDEITYDYGKDYFNIFIKPHGCRCPKCTEKRAAERRAKRAVASVAAKRAKATKAKKAAGAKAKKPVKAGASKKRGRGSTPRRPATKSRKARR